MLKTIINKQFEPELKDFVDSIPSAFEQTGIVIYSGRNTIKVFQVGSYTLAVKCFKKPHLLNQFIYTRFRESKAKRSFYYAQKLIERGLCTPAPVAYMEDIKGGLLKNSYYVSIYQETSGCLRELRHGDFESKKQMIHEFALFTANLHEEKIFHLDYSSGNILYRKDDETYTFYLVDLNRMIFDKSVDLDQACANFRRLWGSDKMIIYFVAEYAKARKLDVDTCIKKTLYYRTRFWKGFEAKYPGQKPYYADYTKIGFDAKRAILNYTGLGNYSRFVINGLARIYPKNTYKLFSPKPFSNTIRDKIVKSDSVESLIKETSKPFWRSHGIVKDIVKQQIDIYHGLSNELPFGINKTKVKTVVTIHDLIFLRHPEFYPLVDRKIYDIKARYACRVADKIVAVSECTKRDIIHFYGTDANKIEVVYQGCFAQFKEQIDDVQKNEVATKYNLPPNFLLSIGSIEDRKNILLIVKALKYLPKVHFVAIGKQREYTQKVKAYISQNNLTDRVHFLHNVSIDDMPAILRLADIFVYPSLYEGFGIPIIEALSAGVPVIAATGSCLEEAGGPHSIYINPYDEKELASEIENLLNDPDRRKEMVDQGLIYVNRFSEKACADNLMNVYKGILN